MSRGRWRSLERDLLVRQDLAPSTAAKTIGYARALESGGVNLNAPTLEQYEQHVARLKRGGARGTALLHHYNAMRRVLDFLGEDKWPRLRRPHTEEPEIEIPPDEVVLQLVNYHVGHDDQDELRTQLLRFAFRFGFFVGARPEQEHLAVRLQDYNPGTGELRIWSSKVDRGRKLQLEPWLNEIIARYVDDVRTEIPGARKRDELLLHPDGRRWTNDSYRMALNRAAREIYAWYRPYCARHWCATWRLCEWDMNMLRVKRWLGHKRIGTTEGYLHPAEERMSAHAARHVASAPAGLALA